VVAANEMEKRDREDKQKKRLRKNEKTRKVEEKKKKVERDQQTTIDRERGTVYVNALVQCTFTNTGKPCTHGVDIKNVPDDSANFLLSAFHMQHFSQRFQPLPKRCPHHRETVRDIREATKEKDLEAALDSSDSEEDQESAEDQPSV
jgi:hypothetical protein